MNRETKYKIKDCQRKLSYLEREIYPTKLKQVRWIQKTFARKYNFKLEKYCGLFHNPNITEKILFDIAIVVGSLKYYRNLLDRSEK